MPIEAKQTVKDPWVGDRVQKVGNLFSMYIGVWQEYELAKMLSARRNTERPKTASIFAKSEGVSSHLISTRFVAPAGLSAGQVSQRHVPSKQVKISSKQSRINAMRELYSKECRKEPTEPTSVCSPLSDEDLINWGVNLDSENLCMFTNIL